jgi:hypothetical protein
MKTAKRKFIFSMPEELYNDIKKQADELDVTMTSVIVTQLQGIVEGRKLMANKDEYDMILKAAIKIVREQAINLPSILT